MVHLKEGAGIDGGIGKAPQGPGHVTLGGKTIQPSIQVPAESHSRCSQTQRATWSDSSKSDDGGNLPIPP